MAKLKAFEVEAVVTVVTDKIIALRKKDKSSIKIQKAEDDKFIKKIESLIETRQKLDKQLDEITEKIDSLDIEFDAHLEETGRICNINYDATGKDKKVTVKKSASSEDGISRTEREGIKNAIILDGIKGGDIEKLIDKLVKANK